MSKYAEVIIDISYNKLDRPFTYKVPGRMQDVLQPGSLVMVPFGKGDTIRKGYVIALKDEFDYDPAKVKEVAELPVNDSGYSEDDDGATAIALAAWMKNRYGSTMAAALKTVLTSRKPGKPVKTREIELAMPREEAEKQLEIYVRKHQVARERLLRELLEVPRQPYSLVTSKLHITTPVIRAMSSAGVIRVTEEESFRNPVVLSKTEKDQKELSGAQKAIVQGVLADYDAGKSTVSLIHGITGSGKTEVYISIIKGICERGGKAIMLIPEIALTYQTLLRFYQYFGERVSVMNSSLSESEKADQWERARRGEIDVIIGPRSALFTPFADLGVIVIDEEHESSYKNESMPKYHTREVAQELARLKHACVVLGSATPSLDSYYKALTGEYRLYTLSERLTGGTLPSVEIADLRQELKNGNRSILSERLQELLQDRLDKGEQSILFLNRRGVAGFVSCRSCGTVIKCPHCDISLSLHRGGRLVCHYCGFERPSVKECPECGSPYISGFRAGTEQIEEHLKIRYPGARVLRLDADTTSRKGSYDKILSSFANREADILVGTQMIVKGHDFPGVTLVGILLADMSLYANDYRAAERTFQLLTQAAGRAGRGEVPGNVVIQTYQPENYAIEYASDQDYVGFYREEIRYRSTLLYPPAAHMLCVQMQSEDEDKAEKLAGQLRELFVRDDSEALVIGPAKGSLTKIRDQYRYVIYIKDINYDKLVRCKDRAEAFLAYLVKIGRDPQVQVQFDFDPVSAY
ncbi:MAG: primosomal protein N' [Lachnospiraceae bacterium]|nr:primosomal protein N' [Lachnospiraceae bacterium]